MTYKECLDAAHGHAQNHSRSVRALLRYLNCICIRTWGDEGSLALEQLRILRLAELVEDARR